MYEGKVVDEATTQVTIDQPTVEAATKYVNFWLPDQDSRFFLSNDEIRAMINGTSKTRSYARDMADEFWKDPRVQTGFIDVDGNGSITVRDVELWLYNRVDNDPSNSELCSDFDPMQYDNDAQGQSRIRFYSGVSCNPIDFEPGRNSLGILYKLFKGIDSDGTPIDGFLRQYVKNFPEKYGGQVGGQPDMSFNPTWNTQ
ncbi:MAG: hypothetical protein QNJ40_25115 [Xanthomonadales bacterium]|nr:hypothetical protein [Xanthomonadales bacterium]